MGQTNRSRNDVPLPKVKKIDISTKHIKLRIALLITFIVIAVVSFVMAIVFMRSRDPGWQQIQVDSKDASSAEEFTFYYNLGYSGTDSSDEGRFLTSLYTTFMKQFYAEFNEYSLDEVTPNPYYISLHPNEEIRVSKILYDSLKKMCENDLRYLYMAPYYEYYDAIFNSSSQVDAKRYSPLYANEIKDYFVDVKKYVLDANHINLEFYDDNKVKLVVSEEYSTFIKDNKINRLISFYEFKNTFIIDAFADYLIENNYIYGFIISNDGYVRNLGNNDLTSNIYNGGNGDLDIVGTMKFSDKTAMVMYRDFPVSRLYSNYFYLEGKYVSQYVNYDGYNQTSIHEIYYYSKTNSCVDILFKTINTFINDTFSPYKEEGINYIYLNDKYIITNDKNINATVITEGYEIKND